MAENNCINDLRLISEDEYIGDSLKTINNNFAVLKESSCDLEQKLDKNISIRTFFYYAPNTPNTVGDQSGLNMQNGFLSYPSNTTIEGFVNNANQLNLIPISESGDQAYVIYQKTGWFVDGDEHIRFGSGQIQFEGEQTYKVWVQRSIGICFAPGTLVETPNGKIPIEQLQVNDDIYGFHPLTKEKVITKVVKTFKGNLESAAEISPLLQIIHEQGELLVTADHWIYVEENNRLYKAAKLLTTNDYLILENGQKSKITSIVKNFDYEYVYNINVEKYHNFIANGVLTGDFQTNDLVSLTDYVYLQKHNKIKEIKSSILTPTGFINVENLKQNDIVYGYDEHTLDLCEQKITNLQEQIEECAKITHQHGFVILPLSQKVFINDSKSYKSVNELVIGDKLLILEDTQLYKPYYNFETTILKIEKGIKQKTYHFEIANTHNYIYNNIYVHNEWVTKKKKVTEWQGYTWEQEIEDRYRQFAPLFVIYRLTFSGAAYVMDSGFPKFSRAQTNSSNNWNQPQNWTTY